VHAIITGRELAAVKRATRCEIAGRKLQAASLEMNCTNFFPRPPIALFASRGYVEPPTETIIPPDGSRVFMDESGRRNTAEHLRKVSRESQGKMEPGKKGIGRRVEASVRLESSA
jgi:hypothetical protein